MNSDRTSAAERISAVVALFATKREAAEAAGVSTDQLARYEKGTSSPPLDAISRLSIAKRVSLDWLATGSGPMRLRPDTSDADADPGRAYSRVKKAENALPDGMSPAYLRDLVVDAVQAVEEWLDERNATLSPEKKAKVVGALVEDLLERGPDTGNVDLRSVASRMLRLVA